MNKALISNLKQLDLIDSEIKIYLFLLEQGLSPVSQISKKTGILRTNCYAILGRLEEKGLIDENRGEKKRKFSAKDPTAILRMIDTKKELANNNLLPELMNLFKSQKNKPVIKFYEGTEQLKEIFLQIYESKEVLGFTSTKKLFEFSPEFFKKLHKGMREREIFLRDIVSAESSKETSKEVKKRLGVYVEHKFLPTKYGALDTDIIIWNNKVSIMTLAEPIFGTVIDNKYIADTLRLQFNMIWDTLPVGTYD
jgi:sugar-specific transcriptional regulator TrmB